MATRWEKQADTEVTAGEGDHQRQREEAKEINERGTLTPEADKQGVTSHLPAEETEYMYRSEDDPEGASAGEDQQQ